ncbi:glycoside hydrolase family 16 protein [Fusarium austroafricanum]|uniref:Glycoside hydrolase family 16 protein n=1 Tax=Fusarium austroafricanum TaxID=2364996 RepID=A0A8H4JJT3_9HYPO|nr:glycoside hydrolase family 16 protein [Fusarium austroafricanum]
MFSFLALALAIAHLVHGACECGYSVQSPQGEEGLTVFMDRLETNFSQLHNFSQGHDWVAQQFTVSAEDGRGNFSKAFVPSNVDTRGSKSQDHYEAGLQLRVGSTVSKDDAISASEVDTQRLDLQWGSFRAGMKLTEIKGTCAAFFWYFNDTQEIDIEFLSQEFDHNNGTYPINLVVQSKKSLEAGYDASKTGTFKRVKLDFDPTDAFHEYRFDYTPGQVLFYADSKLLARMKGDDMPSSRGHLILQHWSNGNPLWSGGPPKQDAIVTVSYVKAYFNSSNSKRQSQLMKQCHQSSGEDSICAIPDVTNATLPGKYFDDSNLPPHDSDNGESNGTASPWRMDFSPMILLWLVILLL